MSELIELVALTIAELDGRHGHFEHFEPLPLDNEDLTFRLCVQRAYRFEDPPG
jgi:hypothetical protein